MKDNAVYLEADEDITSAIDKLGKTTGDSVQIVVPKRSTMLQSIINLKLLKKAAEQHGKELVLVTNDRIAGDLAGRVGLAVAPSLGAKPVIADVEIPEQLKSHEEIIEASDPEPPRPEPKPLVKPPSKRPLLSRRDITDGPPVDPASAAAVVGGAVSGAEAASAAPSAAAKGIKVPKVPNFKSLQRRALWIGAAVVLVGGYLLGMFLLTSAKVTLYANGTKIDIDTNFSVDPALKQTNQTKAVLAGQLVSVSKDLTGAFTPTGKQDVGAKATGTVTFQNCEDSSVYPLAQGNTLTSQGLNFTTDAAITIPAGTFKDHGTTCTSPTVTVNVTAAQNGDKYNLTNATFTSAKLTSNFKITGSMSGGLTKTVTITTQPDIDAGVAALTDKDKDNATRDLQSRLPSGYVELASSQATVTGAITPAPAVGAQGDTGSLTVHITYNVLAVKQTEYQALIQAQEVRQIGSQNQVYDNGIAAAQITASPADSTGRQSFHLTTEAFGGPKLDTAAIAKQLAGKRYGDAGDALGRQPGVSSGTISLWPGWATNLPSRTDKIKITISVANNK